MSQTATDDLPVLGESEAATALVRAYCQWHVAPVVEQTLTLDTWEGGSLLLPTLRLVDVMSCHYQGQDITDALEWSADGMLRHAFERKFRALTITIRHGYEAGDVDGLVRRIGQRLTTQVGGAVSMSQTRGPFAKAIRFGGAGGAGLLLEDQSALQPFRLSWGP